MVPRRAACRSWLREVEELAELLVRDARVLEENSRADAALRAVLAAAGQGERDEVEAELVEVDAGARGGRRVEVDPAGLEPVVDPGAADVGGEPRRVQESVRALWRS